MRYIFVLFAGTLVLGGCGDPDTYTSTPPYSTAVVPSPTSEPGPLFTFDYLGGWNGPKTFLHGYDPRISYPPVVSCPADDSALSVAPCVEAVTLDGQPATLNDLVIGQIVEIHGTRNDSGPMPPDPTPGPKGTVTIDIHRTIVGPVEAIDPVHFQLTVLGQRVYLTTGDSLGFATLADVAVGDIVTVSGHFTVDGHIAAERLDHYTGPPLWLLRGVLKELPGNRVGIGELEVDLSSAAREGFPGDAPLSGDAVIVFADGPLVNGVLTANSVRCTGGCDSARWDTGLIYGLVTAWRSPTDFDIDGRTIQPLSCECDTGAPPPVGSLVGVYLDNLAARMIWYRGS